MHDEEIIAAVFGLDTQVRYVALASGPNVVLRERNGLSDASSGESDRYEELLVNPALLMLTRQRGDIDCGGLRYLIVRYGNFYQIVVPRASGHVSVAVEPTADPVSVAHDVIGLLASAGPG